MHNERVGGRLRAPEGSVKPPNAVEYCKIDNIGPVTWSQQAAPMQTATTSMASLRRKAIEVVANDKRARDLSIVSAALTPGRRISLQLS